MNANAKEMQLAQLLIQPIAYHGIFTCRYGTNFVKIGFLFVKVTAGDEEVFFSISVALRNAAIITVLSYGLSIRVLKQKKNEVSPTI